MNKKGISIFLSSALALIVLAACLSRETPGPQSLVTTPSPTGSILQTETTPMLLPEITPTDTPIAQAAVVAQPRPAFAAYRLEPVDTMPGLQQESIDPQMDNVLVPLALSDEQLERLGNSGVVASPADYPEFHYLYKETLQNNVPIFITSDSLLHAYHLTFDQLLRSLEEHVFLPKLGEA